MKEHLIRNSVRMTSCTQMLEEILEITRTQQYIDSQPVPMQLGANPKSKGKDKDSKGKGKGKDVNGKGKGKDGKNEPSKKAESDDQRKCFYCNKSSHVKAECRKEAQGPCRGRREAGGLDASERHSNGRAAAVLTARRETHINVHHSHALYEQRTNMRFQ